MSLTYRDVAYPLNVFMHVIALEEGRVEALHYGLFEAADESMAMAQARSTRLLLERLPAPPARLLDVGAGLGSLLDTLIGAGYDAKGLTPDEAQMAMMRARYGDRVHGRVACTRFEDYAPPAGADASAGQPFDVIIFQESSQYIAPSALWQAARRLTSRVLVLDEFVVQPVDTSESHHLRSLAEFVACAAHAGFRVVEERDLSSHALPTIDYFLERLPRHRQTLVDDLGISEPQIDELLASGDRYRERYRSGCYGYRLLDLVA